MSSAIPVVILAGGQSRRMGVGDKYLLPLGGKTILEHILDSVWLQARDVLINSNSGPALFARFGCPSRADALPGYLGPLAGLLTGMRWAQELGASHFVTVPADTPFLPSDLIEKLRQAKGGNDIAIASENGGLHPTVGLWPTDLADRLENDVLAGARKMRLWLTDFRVAHAEWPESDGLFFNINNQDDLRDAQTLMQGHPRRL